VKNQSVKAAPYASTPTNEDSNRISLTTRAPGTGGKCAAEGGTSETHTYDTADRLNDPGITYDPLGNTTKLSSSDAGGHELTSTYYVDGQVEKQSQNGQENTYYTNQTTINHYAGTGEALSWKDEGEGKYTRLIPRTVPSFGVPVNEPPPTKYSWPEVRNLIHGRIDVDAQPERTSRCGNLGRSLQ